jgi:site-specific DNA-cytosine methylase
VHALTQKTHHGPPVPRLDGKSNAITCKRSQKDYVFDGEMVRLLDVVELERLQGLPDGYTSGNNTTTRVRLLGNAFCVPVIAHIVTSLKKCLGQSASEDTLMSTG